MKKSLIALAVAGVFAVPVAMAEVTIYGSANLSYDAINNGATTSGASANNVSSNVSTLGFKGAEDLGDGMSAVWQIERQINFDTTTAGDGVRDTYAGLSSGTYGTLIAGVHDTPYKMATRGFDLFGNTIADNRSIMGVITGATTFLNGTAATAAANPITQDARLGNVVAYIAPAFSGLTLAIATTAGAETPIGTAGTVKGSAWSLAALYGAGPLNVNFGYQTITVGSATTGTLGAAGAVLANAKFNAWKIGGSYTMDQFLVTAVYEKTSDSGATVAGAADTFGRAAFYLGGKYNISASDAVKLAYTSAGTVGAAATPNSEATQVSLGYDHSLSKHTSVYALYSKISNKAAANYSFSQGGSTSAINANATTAGATPSVFSLGFKHSF